MTVQTRIMKRSRNSLAKPYVQSITKSVFKIEPIEELPLPTFHGDEAIRCEEDMIPWGVGKPSDTTITYITFLTKVIENYQKFREYLSKEPDFDEEVELTAKEITNLLNIKVQGGIEHIYTSITYPVSNPARFKITVTRGVDVTYGILLYAYTLSYQKMYEIESKHGKTKKEKDNSHPGYISGMLNRDLSTGPYGIWGHDITDLLYNGSSGIEIYQDYIVCHFDCDS